MICPLCYSNPHRLSRCERVIAKSDGAASPAELSPEPASLSLADGGPAPSVESYNTMTDQNISATPYPFYATGGGDDDSVQHAILTSHAGAAVERNQDAQFSAARSQFVHRDVVGGTKDARIESLEAKFELATQFKDSEIRTGERLSRIEAMLAGQQAAQLSRELADVKADGRASKLESLLEKIVAKLP